MNDEAARQGRPDTDHLALSVSAAGAELSAATTPLQMWTKAIFAAFADARDELGGDEYRAFVWVVEERIALEAARLVASEALAACRKDAAA